jgi:hypothetical protein
MSLMWLNSSTNKADKMLATMEFSLRRMGIDKQQSQISVIEHIDFIGQ